MPEQFTSQNPEASGLPTEINVLVPKEFNLHADVSLGREKIITLTRNDAEKSVSQTGPRIALKSKDKSLVFDYPSDAEVKEKLEEEGIIYLQTDYSARMMFGPEAFMEPEQGRLYGKLLGIEKTPEGKYQFKEIGEKVTQLRIAALSGK